MITLVGFRKVEIIRASMNESIIYQEKVEECMILCILL
jgi:hypothetical protein